MNVYTGYVLPPFCKEGQILLPESCLTWNLYRKEAARKENNLGSKLFPFRVMVGDLSYCKQYSIRTCVMSGMSMVCLLESVRLLKCKAAIHIDTAVKHCCNHYVVIICKFNWSFMRTLKINLNIFNSENHYFHPILLKYASKCTVYYSFPIQKHAYPIKWVRNQLRYIKVQRILLGLLFSLCVSGPIFVQPGNVYVRAQSDLG